MMWIVVSAPQNGIWTNHIIQNFNIIVWQRFYEPTRLRIANCPSVRPCVFCLTTHVYRPLSQKKFDRSGDEWKCPNPDSYNRLLWLISLKLSNLSVFDFCETHCQQVLEFSLPLVFPAFLVGNCSRNHTPVHKWWVMRDNRPVRGSKQGCTYPIMVEMLSGISKRGVISWKMVRFLVIFIQNMWLYFE